MVRGHLAFGMCLNVRGWDMEACMSIHNIGLGRTEGANYNVSVWSAI